MSGHVAPGFTPYRAETAEALLAANERPEPVAEQVQRETAAATRLLNRYPDPGVSRLRQGLAARFDAGVEQVLVGPGASELLYSTARAQLAGGGGFVFGWPSYYAYRQIAAALATSARAVELGPGLIYDLDAMLDAVAPDTRLVCICNPNNPTGTALNGEEVLRFARALPEHILLLVDEAYCEFSSIAHHDDALALLTARPMTVLLRTFSKAHGLAGLRVGYTVFGSAARARAVDGIRPTFPVGQAAEAGALAALALEDELETNIGEMRRRRDRLYLGLHEVGLSPTDSETNFLWVALPEEWDDKRLVAVAKSRGVHIASGSELCGRVGLRITVGSVAEIDKLLAALDDACHHMSEHA